MIVHKNDTLSDVQERFASSYPLLTLRFYSTPHGDHDASPKVEELDGDIAITDLSDRCKECDINIEDSVTVSELENAFEVVLGLHVQVFRKSGNTWLQTSATDHWTLGKHQERASEAEEMEHSNE